MGKFLQMKHSKKGFTLVELIVVLVIPAILAAILIHPFPDMQTRQRQKPRTNSAI